MTHKQSIVILGGGIAGLSAAWKLRAHDVVVLESSNRVGGWIQTVEKEGFTFETGPRSCRTYGNGEATVRLIRELELENEILPASPAACIRYILRNQKLQKLPGGVFDLIKSPFLSMICRGLCRDLATSSLDEDASIAEFIRCRFGDDVLQSFINPLVSGVYAGDPEALSIQSCFPSLFALQSQYGSLTKGMILSSFNNKSSQLNLPYSLFTLKRGLSSLIERLVEKVGRSRVKFNSRVTSVIKDGSGWKVGVEGGETFSCKRVISTLPGAAVEDLWGFKAPPSASVAVVNLGYRHLDYPVNGFGYLVPSKEKESILGVVWDSKVFPQQQTCDHQGRLTVMIGGSQAPTNWRTWNLLEVAIDAVKRHMGIASQPDVVNVSIAENAIPQYEVGYRKRLEQFLQASTIKHPGLEFGGALFDGVAINDCIHGADKFLRHSVKS